MTVLLAVPVATRAQSLLDRPPNLSGGWTGAPGTLHFNFLHRFSTSDGPENKVSNVPTFLLAAGFPKRILAGLNYSTNSSLTPRYPNEWELFARWTPIAEDYGAPLDVSAQIGYNNAADGLDGEVSAARRLGIARVIAAGRVLSDPFEDGGVRYAVAGGAAIRLGTYLALAGDVAALTARESSERVAWSAGIHVAIPSTPHTLSLQATNSLVGTLQGASRGSDEVRYGFEFTIPLTLRRYFGSRGEQSAPVGDTVAAAISIPADTVSPAPIVAPPDTARPRTQTPPVSNPSAIPARTPPAPDSRTRPPPTPAPTRRAAPSVVRTGIRNTSYLRPRLQVTAGTTIEWTNNDPLPHTVTAVKGTFNSGLIPPGKTYRHTFAKAGTFDFFCIPHSFMKGVVVVREQ